MKQNIKLNQIKKCYQIFYLLVKLSPRKQNVNAKWQMWHHSILEEHRQESFLFSFHLMEINNEMSGTSKIVGTDISCLKTQRHGRSFKAMCTSKMLELDTAVFALACKAFHNTINWISFSVILNCLTSNCFLICSTVSEAPRCSFRWKEKEKSLRSCSCLNLLSWFLDDCC